MPHRARGQGDTTSLVKCGRTRWLAQWEIRGEEIEELVKTQMNASLHSGHSISVAIKRAAHNRHSSITFASTTNSGKFHLTMAQRLVSCCAFNAHYAVAADAFAGCHRVAAEHAHSERRFRAGSAVERVSRILVPAKASLAAELEAAQLLYRGAPPFSRCVQVRSSRSKMYQCVDLR